MINDCHDGKIDMVITKSVSRFARNTVDCLNYFRALKNKNIGVYFEKEHINTLSEKSEQMFTILSSIAQTESENISAYTKWGFRKQF